MSTKADLKSRILRLLREDEEFRHAVAGLIGLQEILERLDKHEERFIRIEEEIKRLREDMNKGFERHDIELAKLREDMNRGFERYDSELTRLREDMNKGFERYDNELAKLREDMNRGFERYDNELAKLREDMNRGFELVNRHISALGARWGLMAEEAFIEGLKGVLEKEFGLKVEKWKTYDETGKVFGYPSEVEIDITVKDGKIILIEVSSHMRASDVSEFKRKAELYEEKTGKKPDELIAITPYIDEKALETSRRLGIEVYTKV